MTDTVLIIDDSLTVRMDLVEAFTAAGFRSLACGTLAEARALFDREPIDVIVLDVRLPDGDGVDFLGEVRSSRASTAAVLMLSTEAEVKDRVRALKTGADDYVGKPYDTTYVIAKARELMRIRRRGAAPAGLAILVIDDSRTFREELRAACEEAGYRVLTASTGEEGLRLAADHRPAAIMVDGVLPGIDGATVIRRVRLDAALRAIPCLLLTGSGDAGAELRALDAGADAFVRKEDEIEVVLARLAALLRGAAVAPVDAAVSSFGPRKILAVDDSPTYLNELTEMLRGEGYDVVPAHSGEEALELLAVEQVDCILLDLLMPGLGGQETCRRVKAVPGVRDIPLIMLTALDDRAAMLAGLGAGADDYIQKSAELDVLRARVRTQVRRKQLEDETRRIREELLRKEIEATEARAARELAETRAALVEELERKNRELEAFSYSVSHDLRAPLRSIDGFSQALLEDHADQLDATGQGHLHRVRAAAQRMAELIDDMLQLSRVSSADLQPAHCDLSELARGVIAELRRQEPDRAVDVVIQDGLHIDGDSRLLRVALENVLGNAWKFTGKTVAPRIELGVEAQALPSSVFFVRDNGAGFDMAYADKLFRPFQRLHSAGDFPGTGIGLATFQRVIERHGGRVWAEGEVGGGATFFFTLPSRVTRAPT